MTTEEYEREIEYLRKALESEDEPGWHGLAEQLDHLMRNKPRYHLEAGPETGPKYSDSLRMAARRALVDTVPTVSDSRAYIVAWAAAVRAGS